MQFSLGEHDERAELSRISVKMNVTRKEMNFTSIACHLEFRQFVVSILKRFDTVKSMIQLTNFAIFLCKYSGVGTLIPPMRDTNALAMKISKLHVFYTCSPLFQLNVSKSMIKLIELKRCHRPLNNASRLSRLLSKITIRSFISMIPGEGIQQNRYSTENQLILRFTMPIFLYYFSLM